MNRRPVSFLDNVRDKASDLVSSAENKHAAEEEKAEADTEADPKVAGSRASSDEDGDYVGRTNPQFDAEVQESGAEARSEAERSS
jgi:hypothetical protein